MESNENVWADWLDREVWGVRNRRPELYGEISDKGYVYDKN
jgi:hypothetical protein